ncbi:Hypothetical predicted protein [Marmota monax]|uniref:Uncharacterized protein n=1 Tax=Marmota monax TaxID=9995 RepID=A0A5E4B1U7_MARMO|nr:hypothetical protein GHT09_009532 [Marmota monax]VTJ63046.1 Hypothetical predicted protein [Marmota monax]
MPYKCLMKAPNSAIPQNKPNTIRQNLSMSESAGGVAIPSVLQSHPVYCRSGAKRALSGQPTLLFSLLLDSCGADLGKQSPPFLSQSPVCLCQGQRTKPHKLCN